MTVTHLSLVNQKLAFANAMLLVANSSSGTGPQKIQKQACLEAVVLHLYSALHFYLRELAVNNKIKPTELITSIDSLVNAADSSGIFPSEVAELQQLANGHASGWLRDLLRAHQAIFKSPALQKEKKAFGDESLIQLVDLADETNDNSICSLLDSTRLGICLAEFRSLIQRQRETGAEY